MSFNLIEKQNIHFSSDSMEWSTPGYLFRQLDNEFHFTLDPCANNKNAKCRKFFDKKKNGLIQSWKNEIVFMNPPYGREISKWIKKAFYESKNNNTLVVCLIPSRTDTKWWHKYCLNEEIRFLKGRIKFIDSNNNCENNAPFPCAIVIFRPNKGENK